MSAAGVQGGVDGVATVGGGHTLTTTSHHKYRSPKEIL